MRTQAGKRIGMLVLCVLAVSIQFALPLHAYVPLRSGATGVRVVWPAARFPLTFQVGRSISKDALAIASGSDPVAAIRAAMFSWQSIPTAGIRFADLQVSGPDSSQADGINLITIADTAMNREILHVRADDAGAVAQSRVFYDPLTGEIRECDIVLNPRYQFSTNQALGTYDLQTILTHELGHALGCDHSPALNDTMFAVTGVGDFHQRNLSADAVAFASMTYPNQARANTLGLISGRITAGGMRIFGASVTAVNLDRDLIYCALSDPDGLYALAGLMPGRYLVYAEPLDGPATPDQLLLQGADAFYRGLNTAFRTAFAEEQSLGVEGAAKSLEINLTVPAGTPGLNIDRLGRGDPDSGSGYLAAGPVVVNPGDSRVNLWIGGAGTWKVTGLGDIRILGSGVTTDPAQGIRILTDDLGAPVGISFGLRVAPDAAPGPRSVVLRVGNEQVASTGGIVVSARTLPQSTLYFPYMHATPDRYTGIALANSTPETPAVIRMTGRDAHGDLFWSDAATIPADFSLPGGFQSARLEREFFNLPFGGSYAGSMVVESDASNLQGFFLAGDFGCTRLDGAEAFTRAYRQLMFVDVLQDGNTSTEIHLMNTRDFPISVSLALIGPGGAVIRGPLQRTIAAGGKIGESVTALFGYSGVLHSAHVTAQTSEEALAGFALISQTDEICGLNALPIENAGAILFGPQLAVGDLGLPMPMDTRLNIVNAGDARTTVTVALLDEFGNPLVPETKTANLDPGAHFSLDVRTFFGLQVGQGYIKVTAGPGGKLLGNVLFGSGDPTRASLKFSATVPLFASGAKESVFAHVAQGAGYYTGLALLAPEGAQITVTAYGSDGVAKGLPAVRELAVGQRLVSLLSQLVPETEGQVGGYVRISANRPVIGFELFGTVDGQLLSAVPPQPVSK